MIFKGLFLSQAKIGILLIALFSFIIILWYIGGIYSYSIFVEDDMNSSGTSVSAENSGQLKNPGEPVGHSEDKPNVKEKVGWNRVRKSEIDKHGQSGDMFGGVNALFTGIAAVFSLGSILFLVHQNMLQQIEIDQQRLQDKSKEINDSKKQLMDLSVEFIKRFSPQDIFDFNNVILLSNIEHIRKNYDTNEQKGRIIELKCEELNKTLNSALSSSFEIETPKELSMLIEYTQNIDFLSSRARSRIIYNNFVLIVNFFIIYISYYLDLILKMKTNKDSGEGALIPDPMSCYIKPIQKILYIVPESASELQEGNNLTLLLRYFSHKSQAL